MSKNHLFKLLVFIALLAGHMYFYDPSLMKFINNMKELSTLKLNDTFLLNSVVWIIGFWGMVLFLNSNHRTTRISCWALFAVTSFLEFTYTRALGHTFAVHNIHLLEHALEEILPMGSELLLFVGLTALVITVAMTMKPLHITITRTFVVILLASLATVLIAYKGTNLVLPSFYLVPGLILYKYTIVFYKAITSASIAASHHTVAK